MVCISTNLKKKLFQTKFLNVDIMKHNYLVRSCSFSNWKHANQWVAGHENCAVHHEYVSSFKSRGSKPYFS